MLNGKISIYKTAPQRPVLIDETQFCSVSIRGLKAFATAYSSRFLFHQSTQTNLKQIRVMLCVRESQTSRFSWFIRDISMEYDKEAFYQPLPDKWITLPYPGNR
jgi:hypothetical protein